ncbi:protein MICROTUBULE BINDING PROTEIN 2C isoform X2 [Amaranthus tricolor]|uniref:protein MICROTUBULE BINDING PROTEIN 2C isoform X2 n=1 Tax=Amaranthus tricolor TaxID=29722 RepID=UPI00258DC7A5|nr:protein MICROTUBULE BINDING PROTEIN 2C isoform X2 [Amaranthus tricolor]
MYSTGRTVRGREDYVQINENSSGTYNFNGDRLNKSGPNDLDPVLYNDLVQIVPLVQSLIDRNSDRSITRRASIIYTKTPSRDSKKNNRNGVKSKHGDKVQGKHIKYDGDEIPDDHSTVSSASMAAEKEELNFLREQLEDLHRQLSEKDELLKEVEAAKSKISAMQSQVDELKQFANEKVSLTKSSESQLNDAKIKLADKQAAVEKLQWEAKTSNQKVERLQAELDSMRSQISSMMHIFEGLSQELDDAVIFVDDYDVTSFYTDHLPNLVCLLMKMFATKGQSKANSLLSLTRMIWMTMRCKKWRKPEKRMLLQ